MRHTRTNPAEPSAPSLKEEIKQALSDGRISVILCILTIFMAGFCAAHLAKDVLETRPMVTSTAPEQGVPMTASPDERSRTRMLRTS